MIEKNDKKIAIVGGMFSIEQITQNPLTHHQEFGVSEQREILRNLHYSMKKGSRGSLTPIG